MKCTAFTKDLCRFFSLIFQNKEIKDEIWKDLVPLLAFFLL